MEMKDLFCIKDELTLEINENLISDTVKDVLCGLLYRAIKVNFVPTKELVIRTPNAPKSDVPTVSEQGVYIGGKSEKEVLDAFFRAFIKAQPVEFNEKEKIVGIPTGDYSVNVVAGMRILHLCIFPETDYINMKKTIRFAGVLGYTHVVLESWGGMEFQCLKELGWKGFTFTKEQLEDIIKEMRAFKMEIIPMVNCLGHASLSRVDIGKHVVLDQNLLLSDYFLKYGWVWNFKKQKVKDLLKEMRREMCELCGEGEYFHVGLDETYYNPGSDEEKDKIYEYITELCEVVKSEGRTPILWGDMFLNSQELDAPRKWYSCHAYTAQTAKKMLDAVPKDVLIADWHYRVQEYPWKTSVYLDKMGYKTVQCAWYDFKNCESAVETCRQVKTRGVMVTTWHGLVLQTKCYEAILRTALGAFGMDAPEWTDGTLQSADLWRKVLASNGEYERYGFEKTQITEYTDNFIID